jgi:hypothetical protein
LTLFYSVYEPNGMGAWSRTAWPDGKCSLEQPAIAMSALAMVYASITAEAERNRKNG